MRKNKKLNDIILISVLIIASLAFIVSSALKGNGTGSVAVISVDGKTYGEYSLYTDAEIDVSGILTVVIKDGKVSVKDETCLNHFCANHPPISSPGQSIVCLPGGVVIHIAGEGEVDAVI